MSHAHCPNPMKQFKVPDPSRQPGRLSGKVDAVDWTVVTSIPSLLHGQYSSWDSALFIMAREGDQLPLHCKLHLPVKWMRAPQLHGREAPRFQRGSPASHVPLGERPGDRVNKKSRLFNDQIRVESCSSELKIWVKTSKLLRPCPSEFRQTFWVNDLAGGAFVQRP